MEIVGGGVTNSSAGLKAGTGLSEVLNYESCVLGYFWF